MASILTAALLISVAVRTSSALVKRDDIPGLSASEVDSFTPYTYFAKATYCGTDKVTSWNCGVACDNLNGFEITQAGGDGDAVQFWIAGFYSPLNTVVVAHQGTNVSQMQAILTDADLTKDKLDSSFFPGISSGLEVHKGFQHEHSLTALDILASVQQTMNKYETTSVTMIGHSLGAALALLDSVFLPLHLPQGTTFNTVVYGLPRVGNKAFADYVDGNVHLTHINNLKDPVPIIPGLLLGYEHPAGEVHITNTGKWARCPGHDNPSKQCSVGDVPSLFQSVKSDHDGPYNGIELGRCW